MGEPLTPEALELIRADFAEHERTHTLANAATCGFCARAPRHVAQLLAEVERLRAEAAERAEAERVADMRLREWLSSDAEVERLQALVAELDAKAARLRFMVDNGLSDDDMAHGAATEGYPHG